MRLVDRTKTVFIYTVLFFVSVFFIFGCTSKSPYTSTTKSFDKNITKDQLLHAVKRVFILTDKDAFIIDSYRNDLTITKPKAVHKLYTMDIQNDNFYFKIDDNQTKPTINATISMFRTYGVEEEEKYYIDENSFEYELFWDRVEYILGLKKEWKMCNYVVSDGFMCDLVDLDNSWFVDKNTIDLNTSSNERNNIIETIDLNAVYQKSTSKDFKNKIYQEEIYIQEENPKQQTTQQSSTEEQKEDASIVKSFMLPSSGENPDLNAAQKPEEEIEYLNKMEAEAVSVQKNNSDG